MALNEVRAKAGDAGQKVPLTVAILNNPGIASRGYIRPNVFRLMLYLRSTKSSNLLCAFVRRKWRMLYVVGGERRRGVATGTRQAPSCVACRNRRGVQRCQGLRNLLGSSFEELNCAPLLPTTTLVRQADCQGYVGRTGDNNRSINNHISGPLLNTRALFQHRQYGETSVPWTSLKVVLELGMFEPTTARSMTESKNSSRT